MIPEPPDGDAFVGVAWGLLISLPIWAAVFYLINLIRS